LTAPCRWQNWAAPPAQVLEHEGHVIPVAISIKPEITVAHPNGHRELDGADQGSIGRDNIGRRTVVRVHHTHHEAGAGERVIAHARRAQDIKVARVKGYGDIERWRRIFLESGTNGFKRRDTPGAERELKRVQAKVGELTMKLEIVEWLIEKKGYGEELRKLKRSGGV